MKRWKLILVGCSLIGLNACTPKKDPVLVEQTSEEITLIDQGKELVETNCRSCHAIGRSGESRRDDAPPLRQVLQNFDPESLAADFREGIHVGAVDMPDFDFGPLGTDAVIAYLQSIQDSPINAPSEDQG